MLGGRVDVDVVDAYACASDYADYTTGLAIALRVPVMEGLLGSGMERAVLVLKGRWERGGGGNVRLDAAARTAAVTLVSERTIKAW